MKRRLNKRLGKSKGKLLIIAVIISWACFLAIIFLVPPQTWASIYYLPFFLTLAVSIFLTIKVVVDKAILASLTTTGFLSILLLRFLGIKDWYDPLIITGLVAALIYFFTAPKESDKLPEKNLIKQSANSAKEDSYADFKTGT